jgi:hypothetical protein
VDIESNKAIIAKIGTNYFSVYVWRRTNVKCRGQKEIVCHFSSFLQNTALYDKGPASISIRTKPSNKAIIAKIGTNYFAVYFGEGPRSIY